MLIHKQLYALCHHSYCYNTLPAMPAWPQFTKEVPMKLVNQQLIKNTNLKLLYNSIFENRGISRAALAKKTGLSRTAVSALIDELTGSGFLYDSGTGDSAGVGRKPNCLELCSGNHYIAVFGWEEKRVHAQLIDICGSTLLQQELYRTPGDSYTELCHAFLEERMLKLIRSTQLLGICFVLPAMIDPEKETVFSTTISLAQDQGGDRRDSSSSGNLFLLRGSGSQRHRLRRLCGKGLHRNPGKGLCLHPLQPRNRRGALYPGQASGKGLRLLYTIRPFQHLPPRVRPAPAGITAAWSWFSRKKPCPDGFMPKEPPPPFFPCPPSAMPTWGEPPFMGTRQRFR